jgi:hypothetical protein
MVLTFLFGGLSSVFYIIDEVIIVVNRENMDGYFNVPGMLTAILAILTSLTVIPSVICQMKIMNFNRKLASTDRIDEDFSNREQQALKSLPSKFLRNSNLLFSLAVTINYLWLLMVTVFLEDEFSPGLVFVLSVTLILLLCGVVLSIDAFRFRSKVKELLKTYSNL